MSDDGTTDPKSRLNVLECVPLLSCFGPAQRRQLAALFVERSFRKGDVICREGDVGETLYVVASGELEVWSDGTPPRLVDRLTPGEFMGEMSLLHSGRRANTVTAARPSRLLALDKPAFDRYFRTNAKVLDYFSKLLCRRLAAATHHKNVQRRCTVIGVTGPAKAKGRTVVAASLTALLRRYSGREALLVQLRGATSGDRSLALSDLRRAPSRVRSCLSSASNGLAILELGAGRGDDADSCAEALGALVNELGSTFPYLVVDASATVPAAVAASAEACDVLVRIAPAVDGETPSNGTAKAYTVLNLHNPGTPRIALNHCDPFVLPADRLLAGLEPRALADYVVGDPRATIAPPLRRLARKILGTTVGIAMGGGAAYGIATVGILKVLEDNDIPIDLITGCSMGSIVAIGYAIGIRADEMIDIARRIGNKTTTLSALLDVTITRPGLLSGRRLVQIFSPFMGDIRTFEQLVLPCQVVATDIESGERICLGTGPLDVAFRASCSVPMLWSPVELNGRVLVDGGVVDPVPIDVLHEMGADFCIGVNAVPHLQKGVQTVVSRLYQQVRRFDPFAYLAGHRTLTNTFDCVMNTIQTLQHELGHFKAISADVRINPDLSPFTWLEFYRAMEIIDRGIEAAERALPEIKSQLAQRIAAPADTEAVSAVQEIVAEGP
jgi:NTE family protein